MNCDCNWTFENNNETGETGSSSLMMMMLPLNGGWSNASRSIRWNKV